MVRHFTKHRDKAGVTHSALQGGALPPVQQAPSTAELQPGNGRPGGDLDVITTISEKFVPFMARRPPSSTTC